MILVRNKRTLREEAWTDEDLSNAKKSGLIVRFEIVKTIKEPERTAPLREVLSFIENSEKQQQVKKPKRKKNE